MRISDWSSDVCSSDLNAVSMRSAPTLDPPDPQIVRDDVARALAEDIGSGDVTARLLPNRPAHAQLIAREAGLLAGRACFDACFAELDGQAPVLWSCREGARFPAETGICTVPATTRAQLTRAPGRKK